MSRPATARRAAVALSCLAAALAGCSSTHHATDRTAPLVPWDGAVPAQLQAATAATAQPCRAAQLRLVGPGFVFSPAIQGGTGAVTLRNAGPGACRLTGRPGVRLVGAVPAPQQHQIPLPAQAAEFPTLAPPDERLLALPVGGTATLQVDWRNWCVPVVPHSRAKPTPPRALRITLPGGRGTIDASYNAVPPCDAAGRPSTAGVRPFRPAPLAATRPWSTTAVLASIVPLSGKASLTGRRGDVVRFAVELRNPSTAPVSFERCPLVAEMLAPAGRPEGHRLNCGAAGPLAPGASVRFEMRIQIPAGAPDGPNGLFCELDPTGAQGPEAVSRVVVTR